MIDEDAPPSGDGEEMLYDYLKHLTSLCLFSLGGVAALADKVHGRSRVPLVIALAVIARRRPRVCSGRGGPGAPRGRGA